MKPEWNKKYTTIAIYSFLVLCGVAAFVLCITNFSELKSIFSNIVEIVAPIMGGVIFAYLLNPLLNLFDRRLFKKIGHKKNKTKLRRGLSVLCVYLIVILALTAFAMLFIPELIANYHTLVEKYGSIEKINAVIDNFVSSNEFLSQNYDKIMEFLNVKDGGIVDKVLELLSSFIPVIVSTVISIANGIYIVAVSIIFSIYVMCYRETLTATLKKLFTAFLSQKHFNGCVKLIKTMDRNIGKYVRGKLIDSIIVGIVSYIAYLILGFDFAPVLAVIAGVTNMIPFFGPFIGGVPAGIIVLIAQPEKLLLLILVILVLQQLDGNILDPMIVGNEIGLAPVWTLMATLVFGGFFGIPGMFLGVPIFATIYTFVREKVNSNLEKKKLPLAISTYYTHSDTIETDSDTDNSVNESNTTEINTERSES